MKLTGKLRFQITKEWMKRGMTDSLEDFVKLVCEKKSIEYVPPQKETK